MVRLIVNANDGSVIPIEGTFLVTLGEGDDKARKQDLYNEWCEHGSDEIIEELGTKHGKNLESILAACGYGDLRYGNALAFSPLAIRDEIESMITGGVYDEEKDFSEVLENISPDDAKQIGLGILENDYIWNVVKEEILHAVEEWVHGILREREKTAMKNMTVSVIKDEVQNLAKNVAESDLAFIKTFTDSDFEWILESVLSSGLTGRTFPDLVELFVRETIYQKQKQQEDK